MVEIKIDRHDFLSVINEVLPAVEKGGSNFLYKMIEISMNDDLIDVAAFNGRLMLMSSMPYSGLDKENIKFTVEANSIIRLINSFSDKELIIKIDIDKKFLKIGQGRSMYKLSILDANLIDEKFWKVAPGTKGEHHMKSFKGFKENIQRVLPFVLTSGGDKNLECICIKDGAIYTTDKISGAYCEFDSSIDMIIPYEAIVALLKKNFSEDDEIIFKDCGNRIIIESSLPYRLIASKLGGDFPIEALDDIIEEHKNADNEICFDPNEMNEKLERLLIISDDIYSSIKFKIENDNLHLISDSSNKSGKEVLNIGPVKLSKEAKTDFLFNGSLFLKAISKIDNDCRWLFNNGSNVHFISQPGYLIFLSQLYQNE